MILKLESTSFRACLHEGGGPQLGEVTCSGLPHMSCKRDHIKMRDYMSRRVTPSKRVTSPIWGTPPSRKHALKKIDESESLHFSLQTRIGSGAPVLWAKIH